MRIEQISQSPNLPIPNPQSPIANLPWERLILLLAAVVRFWRLDYHSFWFDEAVSLDWAQRPIAEIWLPLLTFVQDKHPPLYYILLHGWIKLVGLFGWGQSDGALRALGVLLGVATVLGVMQLCLWCTKRNVALLTGLLLALSPLLVWYSQELRMFQLASAGIVWSAYYLVRGWYGISLRERIGKWLGMIVALEIALYSYLFSAFILPTVGVTLLGLLIMQRRWREFIEGTVALGIAGLLFLPLARNGWQVGGEEAVAGVPFQDFLANHWRLLRTFTLWRVEWSPPIVNALLILLGGLALLGVIGIFVKRRESESAGHWAEDRLLTEENLPSDWHLSEDFPSDRHLDEAPYRWDYDDDDPLRFLPLVWLMVPLLIANLLLAKDGTIFGEDRYLLFLAPFLLWLIAEGVVWLWSLLQGSRLPTLPQHYPFAGLGGVVVVAIFASTLPTLWSPTLARENWRAAAAYIIETQQSNPNLRAAVVAHVDYTRLPLTWYLRKELNEAALPLYFPFGGSLTAAQVEPLIAPPLQGIADLGIDTLWLTQSHLAGVDDEHLVEKWLSDRFALVSEQFPNGVKLSGFALRSQYPQLPQLASNAVLPNAELVAGLTLAACEIVNPQLSASDDALHPPSGWVHVRLWWQASATINADYIASLQMIGAEGVWGDRLYRGNEALRRWPTSTWQMGDFVRDEIDVNLNPLTPANQYSIVVGVKDSTDQAVGKTVECGKVEVYIPEKVSSQ